MIDFCRKDMKFYSQKFIHPLSQRNTRILQGIMQISQHLQFQDPVAAPSWMKDIQQAEFQAV